MYSNRFVMVVLLGGNPVDARKDGVLPIAFNSEYGIRFRNKHNRRAVVKFTIDGEDVSGPGYIIPAHGTCDILRYYEKDAKFKFVDLNSGEAAEHGKNKDNSDGHNGVIEAKFSLEMAYNYNNCGPYININPFPWHPTYPPIWPKYPIFPTWTDKPVWTSNNYGNQGWNMAFPISSAGSASSSLTNAPQYSIPNYLKDGCTVEGGYSGQKFTNAYINLEADFTTIRMVLRGLKPKLPQEVPQCKVQESSHCTQCGAKRLRKSDKFCGSCGNKF